ncbi:MAG: glycerol-3-phosphate dehydrogenase [Rubrimonas sp.]|uniref:glycerol-3-phosphate dehydrogenase n=1 Tax=Rubrimonas sp. TaxID=2036015 RepID=UPI002FDD6152
MTTPGDAAAPADLFIIGGGVNGAGVARDAAGRGLRVALAEMNDLGSATSSSSTKLFHGGLRYLEFFEFGVVRRSLAEREVLLRAMPHISWPIRFVLPYHKDMRFNSDTPTAKLLATVMPWMKGQRPGWLIRMGLFMYDHLGGRKILPGTTTVDMRTDPVGGPIDDKFEKAYEYSDCWVEDSRLVVLNARDAEIRGAEILPRTKVVSAERGRDLWTITLRDADSGETFTRTAKVLVNAAGPWVEQVLRGALRQNSAGGMRLVRGSHIVTRKLFDHGKCYFFQGADGRIGFAIPYETDFTLIGTTEADHDQPDQPPVCTPEERRYLIDFANRYFKKPVTEEDVVWSYSGVRPLYDQDAKSATAATRDYVLSLDEAGGAPLLNIFGGKISIYRKLSEEAVDKVRRFFPAATGDWTAGVALPGGDFEWDGVPRLARELRAAHPFLTEFWATRLVRAYGTEAREVIAGADAAEALGRDFGATLTAREVDWLMDREYARTAEDVVWRRSKLGLRMTPEQIAALDAWMRARHDEKASVAAAE